MFNQKYPAFSGLIHILAIEAKQIAVPNESLLQKISSSITLIPQVLAFIPQAQGLGAEAAQLKANALDIEQGAEYLVTELAFSSDKAKAIIAAAFPVAEKIAELVPETKRLIDAIKA